MGAAGHDDRADQRLAGALVDDRQPVLVVEPRTSAPRPPRPPRTAEPTYRAGDRVRHPTFGVGIVVSVRADATSEIVEVNFSGGVGVKKLDTSFAPLTRV